MPRVYIETSIVSYLRQAASGQVVTAARQLLTRRWWEEERCNYQLVTSQYVIDEASDGDPQLANLRLQTLEDMPLLQLGSEISNVGLVLLARRNSELFAFFRVYAKIGEGFLSSRLG